METDNSTKKWLGDLLERESIANYLTDYMTNRYSEAEINPAYKTFVLNIDCEWGGGKTFFLTRWKKDLNTTGHPAIYFDAWKNDFSNDPLIAFISSINDELQTFFKPSKNKTLKSATTKLFNSGKKLIKPSLPTLLAMLTKLSIEEATTIFEEDAEESPHGADKNKSSTTTKTISTLVSNAAKETLKQHKNTKNSITVFIENIENLTKSLETSTFKLPIFIFIDELDRCRPSYAIELLENIKHLFSAKGVYFVVATDSKQLCHSIKSIYGESFESSRYLKRFFDQEYNFPEPDTLSFAIYLFNKTGLTTSTKLFFPGNNETNQSCVEIFSLISLYFKLKLRDMEQCCLVLKTIETTWNSHAKIHIAYITFLIMLKHLHSHEAYEKFINLSSPEEKISSLKSFVEKNSQIDSNIHMISTQSDPNNLFSQRNEYDLFISKLITEYIETTDKSFHDKRSYNGSIHTINDIYMQMVNDKSGVENYQSIVNQAGQFDF